MKSQAEIKWRIGEVQIMLASKKKHEGKTQIVQLVKVICATKANICANKQKISTSNNELLEAISVTPESLKNSTIVIIICLSSRMQSKGEHEIDKPHWLSFCTQCDTSGDRIFFILF